jgi:hypothetical protein
MALLICESMGSFFQQHILMRDSGTVLPHFTVPSFPALVDFQLDFATETSDGRWFFLRDNELARKISEEKEDGEDSDDESEEEIMHKWYDTDDSEMNSDDEEGPWRQNDTDTNYD